MPTPDYEVSFPERFISQEELEEHGLPHRFGSMFGDYGQLLQEEQHKQLTLNDRRPHVFFYKLRLSIDTPDFNPLLPSLEPPYMLPGAIALDLIGRSEAKDGEENDKREEIVVGLANLLEIMYLAFRHEIGWPQPRYLASGSGHPLIGTQISRGHELWSVSYRPKLNQFEIKWHQYHPRIIPRREFRDHSLISTVTFEVHRSGSETGVLMDRFSVYKVPWELSDDDTPRLGRGRDILQAYLAPRHPHITVFGGSFTQCKFLNKRLMDVFNIGHLYSAFAPQTYEK